MSNIKFKIKVVQFVKFTTNFQIKALQAQASNNFVSTTNLKRTKLHIKRFVLKIRKKKVAGFWNSFLHIYYITIILFKLGPFCELILFSNN